MMFSPGGFEMHDEQRRVLRHDLRGKWHALRLCMSAFELSETTDEKAEMLEMLVNSATEVEEVVEKIIALPEP
jgi:hypothetical protein